APPPAGRVVMHDPARGPFRIVEAGDFLRRWERSGVWMLVATPSRPAAADPRPARDAGGRRAPAAPWPGPGDAGVRRAEQPRNAEARRTLEAAAEACPAEPAPWRELAGLEAVSGRWAQAVRSARQATARDKDDEHAWRILATGLFLQGDRDGALAAWNHAGEPVIDLVTVHGLDRTRHEITA